MYPWCSHSQFWIRPLFCCFLTCMRVCQEAGEVVWYSHLLKNFPQFVVIHTVRGFSTVNETEADVFLEFPCFFYFQARILEWVAISFSTGSSQPRNPTWVSCIAGRCFTIWDTMEALMIQQMLAIWTLVLLPFLNLVCTSGSSRFTYCWRLTWRILSITLLACEMNVVIWQFEHSLALSFFPIGIKTHLFPVLWTLLKFTIIWTL